MARCSRENEGRAAVASQAENGGSAAQLVLLREVPFRVPGNVDRAEFVSVTLEPCPKVPGPGEHNMDVSPRSAAESTELYEAATLRGSKPVADEH